MAGPVTANIVQVNPGFQWHFQQSIGTHRLLINDRCISFMKHMYVLYKNYMSVYVYAYGYVYICMNMRMARVHVCICFVCVCILCVCECVVFCASTHAY